MNWDEIRKQITIYEEEHKKELSKDRDDLVNKLLQVAGSLKWTCDISANKKIFISKLEEKTIQFTISERKERNKKRNRQAILQIGENVYKSIEYDEGVLLNLITTSKPSVNLSKNTTVVSNPQNSKKIERKRIAFNLML